MRKPSQHEIEALLHEGTDLVDRILAKHGELDEDEPAEEDQSDPTPLVDLIHKRSMFRDAEPDLILRAVSMVSELEGKAPAEVAEALQDDPDLMSTYTRVLARLLDEAEARSQGDDDGRDTDSSSPPGSSPPGKPAPAGKPPMVG
jgi:hypothetical protein